MGRDDLWWKCIQVLKPKQEVVGLVDLEGKMMQQGLLPFSCFYVCGWDIIRRWYATSGLNSVTTVVIIDSCLSKLNLGWPPPHLSFFFLFFSHCLCICSPLFSSLLQFLTGLFFKHHFPNFLYFADFILFLWEDGFLIDYSQIQKWYSMHVKW